MTIQPQTHTQDQVQFIDDADEFLLDADAADEFDAAPELADCLLVFRGRDSYWSMTDSVAESIDAGNVA